MNFCANHNIWFNGYCPHCFPSGLYSSNPAITGLGTGIAPESPIKEDQEDELWDEIINNLCVNISGADKNFIKSALKHDFHISRKTPKQ